MEQHWIRFENYLQKNAPHLLLLINSGATQADIDRLESLINKKLPEDFVSFYKIHNGQDEEKGREGLIDSEELLPVDAIIDQWQCWKDLLYDGTFEGITSEPDLGVKNDWWNPLWIPFTYDGSGNHICVDLDPTPNGNFGQIIRMWHDAGDRIVYASSFREYISDYITGLETGKFVYAKNWGLVDKDSAFNKP